MTATINDTHEPRRPSTGFNVNWNTLSPLRRGFASFFGFALMASAAGLWLVPDGGGDIELVLIKLVASLSFFCIGLVLSQLGRRSVEHEVILDRSRNELQLIERGCDGIARSRGCWSFDMLSRVEVSEGTVRALGLEGNALLQVPTSMIGNFAEFQAALGSKAVLT